MKSWWSVKFKGKTFPVNIQAYTFLEAVEEAKKISEDIISLQYLAY